MSNSASIAIPIVRIFCFLVTMSAAVVMLCHYSSKTAKENEE
jgi:hypothetical protein